MMTIPEETSVTRDGMPLDKMPEASAHVLLNLLFIKRNRFCFRMKKGDKIIRLTTGARPVASTAPKIPMLSGKMKI